MLRRHLHHKLYEIDKDGDKYTVSQGDCNDFNPLIYPSATEICGDGIDQDCDGKDLSCESEYLLVLNTVPERNATGIELNTKITVTFSEDINSESLNKDTFYLQTGEGYSLTTISGIISCSEKTAEFKPDAPLNVTTVYRVTVTKDVKSIDGSSPEADYTWSFATSAASGEKYPEVISTVPENNSSDADITTKISVTFSVEMDPESLNKDTFYIQTGDGYTLTTVSGTISCSEKTAEFKPDALLKGTTVYRVTVTKDIKSIDGHSPEADYTWSFTTSAVNAEKYPEVISTVPADDALDADTDTEISVTFSVEIDIGIFK